MNFKLLFSIVILLFLTQFNFAQGFEKISGQGTHVTINPKNGEVFIIDRYQRLAKFNSNKKKFDPYGPDGGKYNEIAISSKGTMYAVDGRSKGLLKFNSENSVKVLSKSKCKALAIGKNNKPWVSVGNKSYLQQYNSGKWKNVAKVAARNILSIAPYSDNLFYVTKTDESVLRYSNGTWVRIPTKGKQIAYDLRRSEVYLIGPAKNILKLNKRTDQWDPVPGTRRDFKQIAVYNGEIWAVSTKNNVYRYDKNLTTTGATASTFGTTKEFKAKSNFDKIGTVKKVPKVTSTSSNKNTSSNESSSSNKSNSSTPATNKYEGIYRFEITRILTFSPEQQALGKSIDIYGSAGIHPSSVTPSGRVKLSPLNNKKNNMVNVRQNNPANVRATYKDQEKRVTATWDGRAPQSYRYYGEYTVDKIREFRVVGETANSSLTFDLQTNFNQRLLIGNLEMGWKRQMIKVDDIKYGQEQFMAVKAGTYPGTWLFFGYIITKR